MLVNIPATLRFNFSPAVKTRNEKKSEKGGEEHQGGKKDPHLTIDPSTKRRIDGP